MLPRKCECVTFAIDRPPPSVFSLQLQRQVVNPSYTVALVPGSAVSMASCP